jgi:hypothetical protein
MKPRTRKKIIIYCSQFQSYVQAALYFTLRNTILSFNAAFQFLPEMSLDYARRRPRPLLRLAVVRKIDQGSLSMFSIVLYTSPACDCARIRTNSLPNGTACPHYYAGVVVDPRTGVCADSIVSSEVSKRPTPLPIKMLIGQYTFVGTPNRFHYDKSPPGASLAHEDDDFLSATLGVHGRWCFIYTQVYGLETSHFCKMCKGSGCDDVGPRGFWEFATT